MSAASEESPDAEEGPGQAPLRDVTKETTLAPHRTGRGATPGERARVAAEVARAVVDLHDREVITGRVTDLHGMLVTGAPWRRVADVAERIATEAREAVLVVHGEERPALPASTHQAARASLRVRAERSTLTGRFWHQRIDVLGGRRSA